MDFLNEQMSTNDSCWINVLITAISINNKKNESGYVIIFVKGLAFMLVALMTWAFTSET